LLGALVATAAGFYFMPLDEARAGDFPKISASTRSARQTAQGSTAASMRSTRDGHRALIAAVIEEIRKRPASAEFIIRAAREIEPSASSEIVRAAEVGRNLQEYLSRDPNFGAGLASLVPAPQASSSASTDVGAPKVGRSAPSSFSYLTTGTQNGTAAVIPGRTEQTWMAARPTLDASFSAAQRQEFNANWGNSAVGQAAALNATTRPDGTALPGKGLTGRGVTVVVIDSGIDATFKDVNNPSAGFSSIHPEFIGRLDPRSFRATDSGLDRSIMDDLTGTGTGHGTHVAGTIAANFDGSGMLGIAPDANILAVKGIGAGTNDTVALDQVAGLSDVRIINGSYGPTTTGMTVWSTGDLTADFTAARKALAAGKILVYANGNDGNNAPGATPNTMQANPTGLALYPFIRPANANSGIYTTAGSVNGGRPLDFSGADLLPGRIVAVANLGIDLKISPDSNLCGVAARWCISAPGGGTAGGTQNGILSAFPRAGSTVNDIVATAPNGATYAYFNGTSMATPHVAGVLAVLMEAYPAYKPDELVRLMFATADDLGLPGVDAVYGNGLVRLDKALAGSPQVAANQNVAAHVGGQNTVWTAPVSSTGTLTIDNQTTSGALMSMASGANSATGASPNVLNIAGEATFGAVAVNSGVLSVDGTLTTPALDVAPGAMLTGFGDVIGNVNVRGTLNPADGPGEMYLTGNVSIASMGKLQVDIDGPDETGGPGGYDVLYVLGSGNKFTAGGTLAARFRGMPDGANNNYIPAIGTKFAVVRAEAGATISGNFSNVVVEPDSTGTTGMPAASRLDVLYYPDPSWRQSHLLRTAIWPQTVFCSRNDRARSAARSMLCVPLRVER
jgi:subtilisin family serine protease